MIMLWYRLPVRCCRLSPRPASSHAPLQTLYSDLGGTVCRKEHKCGSGIKECTIGARYSLAVRSVAVGELKPQYIVWRAGLQSKLMVVEDANDHCSHAQAF
jgi:hypothetical protein